MLCDDIRYDLLSGKKDEAGGGKNLAIYGVGSGDGDCVLARNVFAREGITDMTAVCSRVA